ncbi:hypothetical protein PENTCL1PPCAC_26030 [Pristionchus entomophagus]|uniref:RING-type domain-containing protein n=1 Tax=Pristionchus entomophagus TaxID=358040 RepID=A0AAV5UAE5_9BILA|nr:hypothetical protein PENTCL1PPCAC_26030 [Pristionchus entomophagus]
MAPRRPARAAASTSSSASISASAAASSSLAAGRSRRIVRKPAPGTRTIFSRDKELIAQAREQFNARQRDGAATATRRPLDLAMDPNFSQVTPGRRLTEEEKMQREVQDLIDDIGQDDRDPKYLKFLFSLDETMEEEESDDSDFDGETEMEKGGKEDERASSESEDSDDSKDSECESIDDEDEEIGEEEDEEEEKEGNDEPRNEHSALLRRFVSGELSDSDEEDYEPRAEEVDESSDEEEGDEFVLIDEEENAAAKLAEEKLRKKEDKEERTNKNLLRTAEYGACTLCAEDTVVDPVGCVLCANFIGCRKCSNRWYRSSKANSDDHIAKCPLCRQMWPAETPDVKEMKIIVQK